MAKSDETGFFEQHVEKIVLAVCLLLLVFVFFRYVVSSPRGLPVVTAVGVAREVPLEDIDSTLEEASLSVAKKHNEEGAHSSAGEIREKQRIADVKRKERAKWLALARALRVKPFSQNLWVANFDSPKKGSDIPPPPSPEDKIELAGLSPLLAPARARVSVMRVLANQDKPADELLGTVACVYPFRDQIDKWKKLTGQFRWSVVAVRIEAERQELLPDGTWGPAEPVEAVRKITLDENGKPIIYTPPVVPEFDGTNASAVLGKVNELTKVDFGWQKWILQPEYYNLWWAEGQQWVSWQWNLSRNEVSDIMTPKEIFPSGGRARQDKPRTGDRQQPEPGRRTPRPSEPGGRDRLGPGGPGGRDMFGPGGPGGPGGPEGPGGSRRDRRTPDGPVVPDRKRPDRTKRTPADRTPMSLVIHEVPPWRSQESLGKLLLVVHDASLQGGKVYRYRIRMEILNPLLTHSNIVKDPADARRRTFLTPFSAWSDRVSVPRATDFFVTGYSSNRGTVEVSVFTKSLGTTVCEKFSVGAGQRIGKKCKKTVAKPDGGGFEEKDVDFSTGAVIVSVNFDLRVLVDANVPKRTVEVIYLDAKGRLRRRLGVFDEQSPLYRKRREEAEQASAIVSAER